MPDLTTVEAVKAWGEIVGTAQDDLLADLVTRASAAVEKYLQHAVLSAAVTEVRDGTGGTTLLLRESPVTAVASVLVNGQAIPAAAAFGGVGWWREGRTLLLTGYCFARGRSNVAIAYSAGHDETPPDIEQATIETVVLSLKRAEHLDVSSKSLAGESITYVNVELGAAAKAALQPHRRVAPL